MMDGISKIRNTFFFTVYGLMMITAWFVVLSGSGAFSQEAPNISWGIDDEQYLTYKSKEQTLDPFGYEVNGPVPNVHFVHSLNRIPFYFSMILPDKRVPKKENGDHTYEMIKKTPRVNPLVRAIVKIKGKRKEDTTVDGHEVIHLHQKLTFDQYDVNEFDTTPYFIKGGTLDVDIYFDPSLEAVRKISYRSDIKVTGKGDRTKVAREETFTLQDHYKIGKNDFHERVQKAIDRGVEYLVHNVIGKEGNWKDYDGTPFENNPHSMILLTLLEMDDGDVPRDSNIIRNGMKLLYEKTNFKMPESEERGTTKVRKDVEPLPMKFKNTYSLSLAMMAMEAYYESPSEKLAARMLMQGKEPPENVTRQNMRPEDRGWMQQARNWLAKAQRSGGGWGYGKTGTTSDQSNTQYGALGLYAALKSRVKFPPAGLKKGIRHWAAVQQKKGPVVTIPLSRMGSGTGVVKNRKGKARGWGYSSPPPRSNYGGLHSPRMAMTAGALGSLEILSNYMKAMNRMDRRTARKLAKSQRDGLAWMTKNWTLRPYPNVAPNHWYYALYALERMGMLMKLSVIGGHRWYPEGAELLLSRQQDDGSWSSHSVSTCFALLFLKRSTSPISTKLKIGGNTGAISTK